MLFNQTDMFARFLRHKSHRSFSSMEVIDIFKHRYGDAYDVALANMLMDSLRTFTKNTRMTKEDVKYEKMWNEELNRYYEHS